MFVYTTHECPPQPMVTVEEGSSLSLAGMGECDFHRPACPFEYLARVTSSGMTRTLTNTSTGVIHRDGGSGIVLFVAN
jgi:hypothetical protein